MARSAAFPGHSVPIGDSEKGAEEEDLGTGFSCRPSVLKRQPATCWTNVGPPTAMAQLRQGRRLRVADDGGASAEQIEPRPLPKIEIPN